MVDLPQWKRSVRKLPTIQHRRNTEFRTPLFRNELITEEAREKVLWCTGHCRARADVRRARRSRGGPLLVERLYLDLQEASPVRPALSSLLPAIRLRPGVLLPALLP